MLLRACGSQNSTGVATLLKSLFSCGYFGAQIYRPAVSGDSWVKSLHMNLKGIKTLCACVRAELDHKVGHWRLFRARLLPCFYLRAYFIYYANAVLCPLL